MLKPTEMLSAPITTDLRKASPKSRVVAPRHTKLKKVRADLACNCGCQKAELAKIYETQARHGISYCPAWQRVQPHSRVRSGHGSPLADAAWVRAEAAHEVLDDSKRAVPNGEQRAIPARTP